MIPTRNQHATKRILVVLPASLHEVLIRATNAQPSLNGSVSAAVRLAIEEFLRARKLLTSDAQQVAKPPMPSKSASPKIPEHAAPLASKVHTGYNLLLPDGGKMYIPPGHDVSGMEWEDIAGIDFDDVE